MPRTPESMPGRASLAQLLAKIADMAVDRPLEGIAAGKAASTSSLRVKAFGSVRAM
jgi:hypothetical protein